jgi:ATP-binding cassette, subfamily B, multidrug efflux pump
MNFLKTESMSVSGSAFDFKLLKRTFAYAKPYGKLLWFSIVITLVSAFFSPLRPWLVQKAFDNYIALSDYSGLVKISWVIIAVLLIESLIQFASSYSGNRLGFHVIHDIRSELFRNLIRFRLSYFDKTPVGTLVTRTVSDIQNIADVFSQGLVDIAGDLLKVIVIVVVMFFTDVKLTLISLVSIPLLMYATYVFKNAIKAAFTEIRNRVAQLNSFVQEHLSGMATVQLFNREKEEYELFKDINKAHRDANIRSVWYYSVFFPVVEVLSAASVGLVVWWGASEAIPGNISVGMIVAFIMYINMLFRPIRQLADRFNTLQMAMVCSERVFKVIDQQDFNQNSGSKIVDKFKGKIEFDAVSFSYEKGNPVLNNVSFTIEPGECVALVGATGSGKTTIASMLSRFYEADSGEIKVDDVNILEYDLKNYRNKIGLVLQEVFLFPGSILENVNLYNPSISEEQVIQAARDIGIHEFIENLPGQYHFNVMERGALLSAGQRQLISFLRAYVQQPQILIMDEATSNIDSETEELINRATRFITRGRTSVIIAHRLSTIQNANTIIVLDKGQVAESGSHQDLLNKQGLYYQLHQAQFAEHL